MGTTSDSAIARKHLEYMTTFEGGMLSSSCTTSREQRRAYRVWLEQVERQCKSEEEFVTAISKPTWTQVAPMSSSLAGGSSSEGSSSEGSSSCMSLAEKREIHGKNQQFFQELMKKQPPPKQVGMENPKNEVEEILQAAAFFIDTGGRLEVGKKIAQGEIYKALFDGKKDGQFAFLMPRYWSDLRKAIDVQILKDKTDLMPPFPPSISTNIMYQIARGMRSIHRKGILTKDLKASSVLVYRDIVECMCEEDEIRFPVHVADFESVEGVMGTGFWRAPEVLGILRSSRKDKYFDPVVWTKKVDVYSYAMTCYEVLSGCIPFQTRVANDYNIGDERPPLPDYVDQEIQELLKKCWDSKPSERPTFEIICDELERFSGRKIKCCQALAEDERDADTKQWMKWPFHYIDESGA